MNYRLSKLLEENKDVWKTESELYAWIRGGIRLGLWNKSPIKIKYINKHRIRIPNPNPRGRVAEVWGGECNVCKKLFVQSEVQVDHREGGNYSIKSVSDIQEFVESVSLVLESELQLVCKPCHSVLSYAAKQGVSFEKARAIKLAIQYEKDGQVEYVLQQAFGLKIDQQPKTKANRRKLLEEKLYEQSQSESP